MSSLPSPSPSSALQLRSRSRLACAAAVVVVIGLGLASRRYPGLLPSFLGKYPGDALWTMMAMAGFALVFPRHAPWRIAAYGLALSFGVEFFQLCQAPWVLAVRATTLGRLALGTTFGAVDLLAYAVGAVLGWAVDAWVWRRGRLSLG